MTSGTSEEEDQLDLTTTPRSRREQLIEVVDNYKEKLRQIKGQVCEEFLRIHFLSFIPSSG